MGAGAQLPVGRVDMCMCSSGQTPGCAKVGAGARQSPVGRVDVCICRLGQAPGYDVVGAGAQLPAGRDYVPRSLPLFEVLQ